MNKVNEKQLKAICEKAFNRAWYEHKSFSDKMGDSMDDEFEIVTRVVLSLYELGYIKLNTKEKR